MAVLTLVRLLIDPMSENAFRSIGLLLGLWDNFSAYGYDHSPKQIGLYYDQSLKQFRFQYVFALIFNRPIGSLFGFYDRFSAYGIVSRPMAKIKVQGSSNFIIAKLRSDSFLAYELALWSIESVLCLWNCCSDYGIASRLIAKIKVRGSFYFTNRIALRPTGLLFGLWDR
ncbi:hypothetical protein M0802_015532 [Mischocyttarus mexicanus]|nr:hypothetical protein M0802_015532 [Mischocyttarus mexicanus]